MNSSLRILLLDDEPSVLFALKLLLQAFGHQVKDFNSPVAAVDFLSTDKGNTIDVILCDLRMPQKDGFTVLKGSKAIVPHMPFVMMSGHATQDEIAHASELGAVGFLTKPFQPQELKATFEKLAARDHAVGA